MGHPSVVSSAQGKQIPRFARNDNGKSDTCIGPSSRKERAPQDDKIERDRRSRGFALDYTRGRSSSTLPPFAKDAKDGAASVVSSAREEQIPRFARNAMARATRT